MIADCIEVGGTTGSGFKGGRGGVHGVLQRGESRGGGVANCVVDGLRRPEKKKNKRETQGDFPSKLGRETTRGE